MPATPTPLPDDIDALKALLLRRDDELQQLRDTVSTLELALSVRTLEIEQLKLKIAKFKRMQFGRKSEKLDRKLEQLETRLEDLIAEEGAAEQKQPAAVITRQKSAHQPLPDHLPREEHIIEPPEQACPECGGNLKSLGEDVSEQLEIIESAFKVIRHVRRKKACASCDCIVQAPAPNCGTSTSSGSDGQPMAPKLPTDPSALVDHYLSIVNSLGGSNGQAAQSEASATDQVGRGDNDEASAAPPGQQKSTVTTPTEIRAKINSLPIEIRTRFKNLGVKLTIVNDSVADVFPELADITPGGWNQPWKKIPGAFVNMVIDGKHANTLVISTSGKNASGGFDVFLHEFGHSIDPEEVLSDTKAFRDNVPRDFYGKEGVIDPYFYGNRKETFAESFARFYGHDNTLKSNWLNLYNYMQNLPTCLRSKDDGC